MAKTKNKPKAKPAPEVVKEDPINAKVDLKETLDTEKKIDDELKTVAKDGEDLTKKSAPKYHANPHAMHPLTPGEPWCEWGYLTKHPIESVKADEYFKTCVNGLLKRNDIVIALVDSDFEHWRGKFVVCEADPKATYIKVKLIEEYTI